VFYKANIFFNVVRHLSFANVINQIVAIKLTNKPLSYYAMRTFLLKAKKAQLEVEVNAGTKDSILKQGVIIYSDGWDNVQN